MRTGGIIPDLEALESEADAFVRDLSSKEARATLVTLSGELGAGKTAFVQALGRSLGVKEPITSPTFVLAKHYELPEGAFSRLVHIDAYRLKDGAELKALNFVDTMNNPKTLILLEWPEMVVDALPKADVVIRLETLPDLSRSITYTYGT